MESSGPHTGVGGKEPRSDSNVVRLPRDWLGPREELVPIGRTAEPEEPLAAADFWSGGESAMHAPIVVEAPGAGAESGTGDSGTAAGLAARGAAALASVVRRSSTAGLAAWARAVGIAGARRSLIVIGAVAAMVCLGVVLAGLGSGSKPAPSRALATAGTRGSAVTARAIDLARAARVGARGVGDRARHSGLRHRPRRHRHGSGSGTNRPATPVAAAYRPARSSDSSSTATSGASTASRPTQTYASQPAASAPPVSSAPPAFGAGGALGPGNGSGTG